MANYGARFLGDSGIVQIDTGYRNFEVLASGTGTGTSGTFSRIDITFPSCSQPPMLFLKTDNNTTGRVAFQNWNKTGANYTGARIIVHGGLLQFSWFVVSPPLAPSTDSWGMRVYDSSGNVVFDGGKRYLRIIDALRVGNSNGFGGVVLPGGAMSYTATHASVSTPYYCLGGGNSHLMAEEEQTSTYMSIRNIDSTSVALVIITTNINSGAYSTFASDSFDNTGIDWIYQCPVIVGVLTD
jgi:hypothetical protein